MEYSIDFGKLRSDDEVASALSIIFLEEGYSYVKASNILDNTRKRIFDAYNNGYRQEATLSER